MTDTAIGLAFTDDVTEGTTLSTFAIAHRTRVTVHPTSSTALRTCATRTRTLVTEFRTLQNGFMTRRHSPRDDGDGGLR